MYRTAPHRFFVVLFDVTAIVRACRSTAFETRPDRVMRGAIVGGDGDLVNRWGAGSSTSSFIEALRGRLLGPAVSRSVRDSKMLES